MQKKTANKKSTKKKAAKKKTEKATPAMGRPTKWDDKFRGPIKWMAEHGATDSQMADACNVTEQTFNNWKKSFPEFFESLKDWKSTADLEVERSLYQRSIGYTHKEDKIFNDNGTPLIVPTLKHYPPDPTSMIFWLKNRKPGTWRDKQEVDMTVTELVIDVEDGDGDEDEE